MKEPWRRRRVPLATTEIPFLERDAVAASLVSELSRFHPDYAEHREARAKLDVHLALAAADAADKQAPAVLAATWTLTWATIVLAAATVVLVAVTALAG